MGKKTRINWIDVAKGICMISVIAGHLGEKAINNVVFSYHLTVFFILSGYTLKNNLSAETLNRRFRSLMAPYFLTCIAVTVMDVINSVLLNGKGDFVTITRVIAKDLTRSFFASGSIKNFGTIELGSRIGAVWFLPATFFAVWFVQALLKYMHKPAHRYGTAIGMAALACLSAHYIWLPFSIQSAFLAAPLVLVGYDCAQTGVLERLSVKSVLVCAGIFAGGIIAKITPVYYVTTSMPDYVLSMVCALSSSICVIWLSQKLQWCKPLVWIGKNSIYYLCIHLFEMETMGKWFSKLLENLGLPYTSTTRFVVKMIFITAVTAVLLLVKKLLQRTPSKVVVLQPTRDWVLDASKAVLIMLVIIGLLPIDEKLRAIIYSFHAMAFVFYSGYSFRKENTRNLPKAIWEEVKDLLLPYGLFGIGYILMTHDGILVELKQLLLGMSLSGKLFVDVSSVGPVYFLLMLFVTRVIYLLVERFVPKEPAKGLCILLLSLLGHYLGKKQYWLPWSGDCALYSLIFYYLGHCFKKYGIMESLRKRRYVYFVLSSLWVFMIHKGSMELAERTYGTYGVVVLGAVGASALLYMLCDYICEKWNEKIVKAGCVVGKNAICILIVYKLFSGYIASIVSHRFTKESLFYAGAMVLIQVFIGVFLGVSLEQIKNVCRNMICKKVQLS